MGDFKLNAGPLTPDLKALAEKELRETPENVKQAVEELRELLRQDDTIYFSDEEEVLLIFLRPCHFYAESAYKLVSLDIFKIIQNVHLKNINNKIFYSLTFHINPVSKSTEVRKHK